MKECSFCKDKLTDEIAILIRYPGGDDSWICRECMDDLNNFFKSGKAEKRKIETEKPHLMVKTSPQKNGYAFFGMLDGEEREYENVFIKSIDTKGLKNFVNYGGRAFSSPPQSAEDYFCAPSGRGERRGYEFSLSGIVFIDREKPEFFDDGIPF